MVEGQEHWVPDSDLLRPPTAPFKKPSQGTTLYRSHDIVLSDPYSNQLITFLFTDKEINSEQLSTPTLHS